MYNILQYANTELKRGRGMAVQGQGLIENPEDVRKPSEKRRILIFLMSKVHQAVRVGLRISQAYGIGIEITWGTVRSSVARMHNGGYTDTQECNIEHLVRGYISGLARNRWCMIQKATSVDGQRMQGSWRQTCEEKLWQTHEDHVDGTMQFLFYPSGNGRATSLILGKK